MATFKTAVPIAYLSTSLDVGVYGGALMVSTTATPIDYTPASDYLAYLTFTADLSTLPAGDIYWAAVDPGTGTAVAEGSAKINDNGDVMAATGPIENQQIPRAMMRRLGTRADGVMSTTQAVKVLPGEVRWFGIECAAQLPDKVSLDAMSSVASSSAEFTVTAYGCMGTVAKILVDATQAEATDTTELTFTLTPASSASEAIKVAVDIEAVAG